MQLHLLAPVEILLGLAFGLVFGLTLAGLVGACSMVVTALTERTLPPVVVAGGAVVLAGTVAIAVGVVEITVTQSTRLLVGAGVVFALAFYAASYGTRLATELPRATALKTVRERGLAGAATADVDAVGQVTLRSTGSVRELEGYPPLEPSLRAALVDGSWRLPADLPLPALERRLEDRLRTTHDLAAVDVAIDGHGRVTVTAAPPLNPIAKHVPHGWRAVSVSALRPAGIESGERVSLHIGTTTVSGRLLSVSVDAGPDPGGRNAPEIDPPTDRAAGFDPVTVAVPTARADAVLTADRVRITVDPHESTPAFDAVSLLERAGSTPRTVSVTERVRTALADTATDVEVFAVRSSERAGPSSGAWTLFPTGESIEPGSDAILVGPDADEIVPVPDRWPNDSGGEPEVVQ